MRITNDDYTPIELVAELIAKTRGITDEETKEYFSGERSSHDWLVKTLTLKLDVILESFKRYGTHVAETQNIRDYGVDVRLIFEKPDYEQYRVGFQIKSNREAVEDAKRPRAKDAVTMIATLKRQAFEADQSGRVDEWWIFSCFDMTSHKRLVSTINVEIGIGKPKGMKIQHVTPREAMALLSSDDEEIDAICTLLLCEDDEVLKMAREEIIKMGPIAQTAVLGTLGPALEGDRILSEDSILNIFDTEENDSLSDLPAEIYALESNGYLKYDDGVYVVEPSVYIGLCALYFEARARHGYRPNSASSFVSLMTSDFHY